MAWTAAHAHRLLWRAGFSGPPTERDAWGSRGHDALVRWLLAPGEGALHGPAPMALDPVNTWGHDGLWWLDRMVRTDRPLRERMTLFWHDHLACTDQETPLMLAQNRLLRRHALGSVRRLLHGITQDPAMQAFLSLLDSSKEAPNENFARELMELFTLGAGGGYTERDVREAARALTGWQGIWRDGQPLRTRFVRERHDGGVKVVFGRRGRFGWREVVDLCMEHPAHAPFLVGKLWSHFTPEPLDRATRKRLVQRYRRSGHRVAPVVEAILRHPALLARMEEPALVKWPAVQLAGALREIGRGVDVDSWTWLSTKTGQQLFRPPSVAGWDTGPAWLSTATVRGRIQVASYLAERAPVRVPDGWRAPADWDAARHVEEARAACGRPWTSPATDAELGKLASRFLAERAPTDVLQSALRHLLLSGPDAHLC